LFSPFEPAIAMPFIYNRSVYFRDTDAAGVVYFAQVLVICHEAYEASLAAFGVNLRTFFQNSELAIPITHASVDFLRPIYCGDRLLVYLTPQLSSETEFQVKYALFVDQQDKPVSQALTRHVCIHPTQRRRKPLSEEMQRWCQTCQG